MQLVFAMLIDPFLLLGLVLMIWERTRISYVTTFAIVAIVHILLLMLNPFKDAFFYNYLFMRLAVDAVVLIGVGYFFQRKSS